jgi:hypothetical protein
MENPEVFSALMLLRAADELFIDIDTNIYDVNVLACSFLNICNKNDQLKVSGHNCLSLSSPYIFHTFNFLFNLIREVV